MNPTKSQQRTAAPLSKALAPFASFQSALELGLGYEAGKNISCGADGDVCVLVDEEDQKFAGKRMRLHSAVIQRHAQQEISAVFHARKKYAHEIGDLASLGHPNIVAYLSWFGGTGGVDREVWLVMELCDFSLSDLIFMVNNVRTQYEHCITDVRRQLGPQAAQSGVVAEPGHYRITESELLKLFFEILGAVVFLNRHGIMHRDIKVENILWKRENFGGPGPPQGLYKLADFGTAASVGVPIGGVDWEPPPKSKKESAGPEWRCEESGTLWTMAPELLGRRPHGASCDVWSLGMVMLEVALLQKPLSSKDLLAYRNSDEANFESTFWPFILAQSGAAAGSAKVSSAEKKAPPRRASTTVISRANSLPMLQSPTNRSTAAATRRRPSLAGAAILPPLPTSPTSSTPAQSPSQAGTGASKREILKKQHSRRWCYSEDLRSLVLDEMLVEETSLRPSPAALWARPNVSFLVEKHGHALASCPAATSEQQANSEPYRADANLPREDLSPKSPATFQELLKYATAAKYFQAMEIRKATPPQSAATVQ